MGKLTIHADTHETSLVQVRRANEGTVPAVFEIELRGDMSTASETTARFLIDDNSAVLHVELRPQKAY